jgi:hypothetical protein
MYGIVNQAIQGLIIENYGHETWKKVLDKSELNISFFLSNEAYDDAVTFKLAQSISEIANTPLNEVLIAFGEYWVLKTGVEKYGSLMKAGGSNLKDFLMNLPNFHNRIMLLYPKLTPPEFEVSNIEHNSIHVHYKSTREGLKDFVIGLLQGLGKMYATTISIELINSIAAGDNHEIFKVSW